MKLQAEMLKVVYKDDKFKDIEKIEIIPRNDYFETYKRDMNLGIKNNSQIFISKNHFRFINKGNDSYRTLTALGFKIIDENADDFVLNYTNKHDADDFISFEYRECENGDRYFFDKPITVNGVISGEIDKATIGYVNPGSFYIWVFNKNCLSNEEKSKAANQQKPFKCFVLPSSMSLDTYKKMIDEIISINRNLVLSKNGKQSIAIDEEQKVLVDSINQKLQSLEYYLKKINNSPKTALTAEEQKISLNKIKKFTSKTILEHSVNPQKLKFPSIVYTESFDIYEHRMIKYALLRLKDYVKQAGEQIKEKIEKKPQDKIEEIEDGLLKLAEIYSLEGSKVEKINKLQNLLQNVEKFLDHLTNSCKKTIKKEDFITIEIIIFKNDGENSADGIYKISYEKCCLCSEYEANYKIIEGKKIPQLCRSAKYFIIKDTKCRDEIQCINSKNDNASGINIKLESNDLEQHYKLYHILKERKCNEKIVLKVQIKPKKNEIDPLRGDRTSENFYDYTLNIKNIESIIIDDKKYNTWHIDRNILNLIKGFFLHSDRYEDQNYTNIGFVLNQIKLLKDEIGKKKKMIGNFNKKNKLLDEKNLIEKIDSFLKLPFLQMSDEVKCIWKNTQIFTNDYRYNKVYRILNKMDEEYYYIDNYNAKEIINEKLDKLYEYWIFIKVVEILINEQKWELENANEYKKIIYSVLKSKNTKYNEADGDVKYIINKNIILNKTMNINNVNFLIKLEIRYDTKVYYDPNVKSGYNRPDFRFIITVKENGKEKSRKNFYFDAKYRDYNDMGLESFVKEIVDVAIGKYIKKYDGKEDCSATASFIVHSDDDKKFTYWGGYAQEKIVNKLNNDGNKMSDYCLPKHRYGAFCFLPGKTGNFITFMKLIMEYHFRSFDLEIPIRDRLYKTICWECGSIIDKKDIEEIYMGNYNGSNVYKYHMECKNCGHFWVKNHCDNKNGHHDLIKHAYHNYHELKAGLWYVKCPECDDINDTIE